MSHLKYGCASDQTKRHSRHVVLVLVLGKHQGCPTRRNAISIALEKFFGVRVVDWGQFNEKLEYEYAYEYEYEKGRNVTTSARCHVVLGLEM